MDSCAPRSGDGRDLRIEPALHSLAVYVCLIERCDVRGNKGIVPRHFNKVLVEVSRIQRYSDTAITPVQSE